MGKLLVKGAKRESSGNLTGSSGCEESEESSVENERLLASETKK